MRNKLLFPAIVCSAVFFLLSCAVSQNQTPSPIGLVRLNQYSLANNNSVQDTLFKATRNQTEFNNMFTPNTSTEKLDLYGKIAVAIALKTPAALQFERAEKVGNRIPVYAQSCTTAQPNCSTGNIFLATVPNVGDAKTVYFYINNHNSGQVQL